jgi:hypothetical protein
MNDIPNTPAIGWVPGFKKGNACEWFSFASWYLFGRHCYRGTTPSAEIGAGCPRTPSGHSPQRG